jgi:hypothetical protein
MRIMKPINYLLAILLCLPLCASAQEAKTEIRAMHEAYGKARSYSMNIETRIYRSAGDAAAFQTFKGKAMKSGFNYYSEMMGRTTLVNGKCCVLIDKSLKVLIYSEQEQKKEAAKAEFDPLPDSVLFEDSEVKTLSKTADAHVIELLCKIHPTYEKIELTINPKNHAMSRVRYFYRTVNGRAPVYAIVDVVYTQVLLNTEIPVSVFSERQFITVTKSTVQPSSAYTGYQVIDQRQYSLPGTRR